MPFGHDLSLAGVQKVDGYGDADTWNWPQPTHTQSQSYTPIFDPSLYANFPPQPPVPGSVQPRHHSIATSHVVNTGTSTPPPPRQQAAAGSMVKAQPAFKPTWHGFLDSTKDAMTIVEAALQGRLSHISRRPHDKERAEMLTSGTILVYEENASGIKRWTDAVHWSPSRVMNNCLIYRQLVRALKPDEKKAALNPSCGTKRKRKESTGPSVTKAGDNVNNSEDEYENSAFDSGAGDLTPSDSAGKVYANFAQTLTPDQQRRFCGSLIDSYEFKEAGLMKKTISVKYQGTTHHIISYYSLEDVVNGKLKRPFQDSKLADVQPRPELLTGWKVSLEDEESKDLPLVGGYSQQLPPSHMQHQSAAAVTHGMGTHGMVQTHTPLHLQVPEYWHSGQVNQYTPTHQSPQHYAPAQPAAVQFTPQQNPAPYPAQQPSPQHYSSQQSTATQQYPQAPSSQSYPTHNPPAPQFSSPASSAHHYPPQSQPQQFSSEQQVTPTQHYPPQPSAPSYPATHHASVPQPTQYAVPQASVFDIHVPVHSNTTSVQQSQSPLQHEPHRRASAPVSLQTYDQTQYHVPPQQQTYYMPEHKYPPGQTYGY